MARERAGRARRSSVAVKRRRFNEEGIPEDAFSSDKCSKLMELKVCLHRVCRAMR